MEVESDDKILVGCIIDWGGRFCIDDESAGICSTATEACLDTLDPVVRARDLTVGLKIVLPFSEIL